MDQANQTVLLLKIHSCHHCLRVSDEKGKLGDALDIGARDGITSLVIGGVAGGVTQGISALLEGRTFWTGSIRTFDIEPLPTIEAPALRLSDEADDITYPSSYIDSKNNPNYKPRNYREKFKEYNNATPPSEVNAHHNLPKDFKNQFNSVDININHPKNMSWWLSPDHQRWERAFNAEWRTFFRDNPNFTRQQVMDEMIRIKAKFGMY